jgi:outer membrane protein
MRAITLFLGFALLLPPGLAAQTNTIAVNTNATTRSLSLEEALRLGVEKNFALQIARIDTGIARAGLLTAYGYYDPLFVVRPEYESFTEKDNTVLGNINVPVIAGESQTHSLEVGLQGNTPWGMEYDLGNTRGRLRHLDRGGTNGLRDYNIDLGFNVTQHLLRDFWIDQGRMNIRFNRAAIRISEYALLLQLMTVIRDIRLNYYELVFAREDVVVREKAYELATRLAAENKKRVEVGTLAPLDEKQAEAQAATARAELLAAMQRLGTQQRILINLITDNYQGWHGVRLVPSENLVAVPQTYNLPSSWVTALNQRPDFNGKKQELAQQGILVEFRQNQVYPFLDLFGGYGRRGVGSFSTVLEDVRDDIAPHYNFGIVFSIPLGNRDARGRLREAKGTRERVQLEMQELHQQILVDVEIALGAAQSEFERVSATREARLAAEAAYDAEVKKLENGKSTSFQVLSLQNDLTTARSLEIRALADYNRALTQLYFNEGTILERSKISVER